MSCKCQSCGNQYKKDLMVPKDIWKEIKPEGKSIEGGLLCMKCIGDKIEKIDKKYEVYFMCKTQRI